MSFSWLPLVDWLIVVPLLVGVCFTWLRYPYAGLAVLAASLLMTSRDLGALMPA